jgi:3'-phosphoadenosine 5'-phosphosulfate (PAPS) 3'-phosphatase
VYAPAIGRLWVGGDTAFACEVRLGAEPPDEGSRRQIRVRRAPASLVAFASRSHLDPRSDAFLKGLPIGETRFAGSSLKFCLIAEGLGDVYPRFAPTMEWDTAAGDAVLRAAGGLVRDPRTAALLRQDRRRIAQWTVHRLGRPNGRQSIRILKLAPARSRAINCIGSETTGRLKCKNGNAAF